MRVMKVLFVLGFAFLLGCGSVPAMDRDAGHEQADSGTPDAGTPDSGVPDAGMATVGIPVLTAATVVTHGTHQITWRLPASGCSTVSLTLKVGTGTYSEVKMVTGTATSTQHSPGHANGTYCYQVTCTLNGMVSAPSNEKCVTQ